MISLVTIDDAQDIIAKQMRELRLSKGWTQAGLAERSNVAVPTLRKFELTGIISLESFLKLCMTLDCLDQIINATRSKGETFSSIDEVLESTPKRTRQRGWRK